MKEREEELQSKVLDSLNQGAPPNKMKRKNVVLQREAQRLMKVMIVHQQLALYKARLPLQHQKELRNLAQEL